MSKNSNIILGHPRRKFEDGAYIDIYTDPFIDLFPKSISFLLLKGMKVMIILHPQKQNIFSMEKLYIILQI